MKAWQMALEAALSADGAPAVLNRDLLGRLSRTSRAGDPVPVSSLTHWLKAARARGKLQPVVAGLYINRFRARPGSLEDAAHWLKVDAILSLNTVLGDAGVLNNPSHTVTAVVPIDQGAPSPKLGRMPTQAGMLQFFGLPRRILEAGDPLDRLDSPVVQDHVRATPEKALLDWLYLGLSPRSRRTSPPREDIDLKLLDRARLKRLAHAMGLDDALAAWVAPAGRHA
jgi:hypothetical protein